MNIISKQENENEEAIVGIQEMCRIFQVSPRTLRFYESKELLSPIRKGQHRLFTKRERGRMKLIMQGKRFGFSLEEIRQLLNLYSFGDHRTRQITETYQLGLKRLNSLGYGKRDSDLKLNLVYNPDTPALPPPQEELAKDYKRILWADHEIEFNELFALANMPISRFGARLLAKGDYVEYMNLLRGSFSQANLETVMCRSLISVDYQGYVYDCDFNQMLMIPLVATDKPRTHLSELLRVDLTGMEVAIGEHCYGCTAGQGSSCGGALN